MEPTFQIAKKALFNPSANTLLRTYTLPNKDGTVAMTSDITGTNSGTNTGDQTSIVGITGTISQFNAACTDQDFASVSDLADMFAFAAAYG